MTELKQIHFNFIKNHIPKLIINNNKSLHKAKLTKCEYEASEQLNGFMSAIYLVDLEFYLTDTNSVNKLSLIVKLMKGDSEFRINTKSTIQFSNENYVYKSIIPYYKEFLGNSVTEIDINQWTPCVYYVNSGQLEGLGDCFETVLVLENLSSKLYRSGPRLDLDKNHLLLMAKTIAEYHSLSYALRIQDSEKFNELVKGLVPLSFIEKDNEVSLYNILYEVAFDRLFKYVDSKAELLEEDFMRDLNNFKNIYGHKPLALMEKLRADDYPYSVILHGDYNRNNVLFQYNGDGYDCPEKMKMIDFQEVRYGSPCIDLSFFMYMNMSNSLREVFWDELLKCYHETLLKCLMDILKCKPYDKRLLPYSFNEFKKHFEKFAFYGAMVSVHFLPWMASPEDELNNLAYLFETNMYSKEFKEFALVAGGDDANERILNVVKHASAKGYMKIII